MVFFKLFGKSYLKTYKKMGIIASGSLLVDVFMIILSIQY